MGKHIGPRSRPAITLLAPTALPLRTAEVPRRRVDRRHRGVVGLSHVRKIRILPYVTNEAVRRNLVHVVLNERLRRRRAGARVNGNVTDRKSPRLNSSP